MFVRLGDVANILCFIILKIGHLKCKENIPSYRSCITKRISVASYHDWEGNALCLVESRR